MRWLGLVLLSWNVFAATPAIVRMRHGSNTLSATFNTGGGYKISLPEPTLSGNAVVVAFTYSFPSQQTFSATTDQSETCTVESTQFIGGGTSQGIIFFACLNAAVNTQLITINNATGNNFQQCGADVYEVANLATSSAFDGANIHANAGTTTVTSGTFSPGTSGDFMLNYVVRYFPNSATAWTKGSDANISWGLVTADLPDGVASQAGVFSSTGSTNCTMTMTPGSSGTNDLAESACIALKSAASGTTNLGSGIHVVVLDGQSFPGMTTGANTYQVPIPSTLKTLVMATNGGGMPASSVTDSHSNTWQKCGTTQGGQDVNPTSENWYTTNATLSPDMTVTVNVTTTTDNNNTGWFYGVSGAALSSACGASTGSSGNQGTGQQGNLTAPPSLTPQTTGSLIVVNENHVDNTAASLNGGVVHFDSILYNGEPIDGPENVDQNGGLGHYITPNTTAISFVWTFVNAGEPLQGWATTAMELKAAPNTTVPGQFSRIY